MYHQNQPPIKFIVIAVLICFGFSAYMMHYMNANKVAKLIEETEGIASDGPGGRREVSIRIQDVQKFQYSDPDKALRFLEKVLEAPEDDAEKASADELLAAVLNNCFNARLKNSEFDQAKAFVARMEAETPDSFHFNSVKREWGRSVIKRWRDAVAIPDDGAAERLFSEVVSGEHFRFDSAFLSQYQKYKLDKYQAALKTGDDKRAESYLLEAAGVLVSPGGRSQVVEMINEMDWTGQSLYAFADELLNNGRTGQAIHFYRAARSKSSSGNWAGADERLDYETREKFQKEIQLKTMEALVTVADKLGRGEDIVLTTMELKQIYTAAANAVNDMAMRYVPLRRRMDVEIDHLFEISGPMQVYDITKLPDEDYLTREALDYIYEQSHDARNEARNIIERSAVQVWEAQLADFSFDPLPAVNPDIASKILEKFPDKKDTAQRNRELLRMARNKEYLVPLRGLEKVQERLYEVLGRWGVLYADGNIEEGTKMLRTALRGTQNDKLRKGVTDALQKMIRQSHEKSDFEQLYLLSRFYISEIGVHGANDPFKAELVGSLQTAGNGFREKSVMKYIFIQSLIAETLPGEEEGEKARKEAMELAFRVVSSRPLDLQKPALTEPSNLNGMSVAIIDNSTDYHLLSFYNGPESFFVRFSPRRKGSIVLKDGKYKLAVLSTTGDIYPYRGETEMKSEVRSSFYSVHEESTSQQDNPMSKSARSSAYGDYALLRSPAGVSSLKVDGKTGKVSSGD